MWDILHGLHHDLIAAELLTFLSHLPAMEALVANATVFIFVFHCCRYGKSWKKPTKIVTNVPAEVT